MCGFALYYHGNDYNAINDANRFAGLRAKLVSANAHRPLFNGNISAMAVNIGVLNKPVLYNYTYDQLNRLVAMDVFNGTNTGANLWSGTFTAVNGYRERISYDANGNILKYFRKADSTGTSAALNGNMDSLTYNYIAASNKLSYVRDKINSTTTHSSNQTTDIDDQASTTNYTYDAIGNLLTDAAESITSAVGGIKWNVYGKITEINKASTGNSSVKKITYTYDAAGNRISKKVERYNNAATDYTYYVRDASGNTMSVYAYTDSLRLTEQYLYGSSRLGSINPNSNMQRAEPAGVNMPLLSSTGKTSNFIRGLKFFELSNHLGNVLVVLSDKKKGIQNGTTGSVLYYLPIVKSAQDYYPFGMVMPGRKFSSSSQYRYGFNGKEEDDEVKGDGNQQDYGMRIYDPRLGRFLSVDPLTRGYPYYTPYSFAGNKPIIAIDLDGAEEKYVIIDINFGKNLTVENANSKIVETGFKFGVIPSAMGTGMLKIGYTPNGPLGSGTLYTINYSHHVKPDEPNGDAVVSGQLQFYIPSKSDMKKGMGGLYMVSKDGRSGGNDTKRDIEGDDLIPINVDLLISTFQSSKNGLEMKNPSAFLKDMFSNSSKIEKGLAALEFIKITEELADDLGKVGEKIIEFADKNMQPVKRNDGLAPVFKKIGNTVYRRDLGFTTENTDGKGGGMITTKPAKDTFPKEKSIYYPHPLKN